MAYQEINQCKSIENLPNEIFKDVPGYEGLYQVSNLGRVKSLNRKIFRKSCCDNDSSYFSKEKILSFGYVGDYLFCNLCKNKKVSLFLIHRLVMLAFKGYSDLTVNHKDTNKQNNNLNNLEYCTQLENNRHARKNNLCLNVDRIVSKSLKKRWRENKMEAIKTYINNKKIKVKQYDIKNNFIKEYESMREAERQTNITCAGISSCIRNKSKTAGGYIWKYA